MSDLWGDSTSNPGGPTCRNCGASVEPNATFCWGCNTSNPVGKSNGSSGKTPLIVVGAIVGLILLVVAGVFAAKALFTPTSNDQPSIQQTPTPTPSDDDEAISKQSGN